MLNATAVADAVDRQIRGWSRSQGSDHCGLVSCDTGLQGQPPCGGWLSWPNLGKGPFRTWNVWERKLAESTTFGDYFPSTAVGLLHTYDSSVAHIHTQLYNYFKLFFGVKLAVLPWRHYGNYSTRGQRETNGSRGGMRERGGGCNSRPDAHTVPPYQRHTIERFYSASSQNKSLPLSALNNTKVWYNLLLNSQPCQFFRNVFASSLKKINAFWFGNFPGCHALRSLRWERWQIRSWRREPSPPPFPSFSVSTLLLFVFLSLSRSLSRRLWVLRQRASLEFVGISQPFLVLWWKTLICDGAKLLMADGGVHAESHLRSPALVIPCSAPLAPLPYICQTQLRGSGIIIPPEPQTPPCRHNWGFIRDPQECPCVCMCVCERMYYVYLKIFARVPLCVCVLCMRTSV